MTQPDDPEDLDPGLARERTRLAWIRTSISFAAVGAAVLKVNLGAGVTVLAMAPIIWMAGSYASRPARRGEIRPRLLLVIALAVAAVALVVLVVVLVHGSSPGFHPPPHVRTDAISGWPARA
jgi:uncharacterized membrane protein YidH (DUF202 family)